MPIPTAGRVAAATMAVLFVSGGLSLSGQQQQQQQPPPPPPTPAEQLPAFRSGVELVTIDVGVVDRQGLPVRGLAPTDFTVTVGGETRRVVTAEFVELGGTQSDPRTLREASVISSNEGGGVGRLVVFVVDQNTLEAGSFRYVATASSRFFDRLTLRRSVRAGADAGRARTSASRGRTISVKEALLHVTGHGTALLELGIRQPCRSARHRQSQPHDVPRGRRARVPEQHLRVQLGRRRHRGTAQRHRLRPDATGERRIRSGRHWGRWGRAEEPPTAAAVGAPAGALAAAALRLEAEARSIPSAWIPARATCRCRQKRRGATPR